MTSKIENLVMKRGMAICVDHMIIAIVSIMAMLPAILSVVHVIQSEPDAMLDTGHVVRLFMGAVVTIPLIAGMSIFVILYEPYCTYRFGWTLGKKICGLRVVDDEGKKLSFVMSFVRFLLKSACMSAPYINFVLLIISWVRQTKGKKALWDEWINTNVVRSIDLSLH